ncbi:hypothetical protein JHK86_041054 [Glycine max]|nr:hypothetical protein JHK86_041054 [Glycine max]
MGIGTSNRQEKREGPKQQQRIGVDTARIIYGAPGWEQSRRSRRWRRWSLPPPRARPERRSISPGARPHRGGDVRPLDRKGQGPCSGRLLHVDQHLSLVRR